MCWPFLSWHTCWKWLKIHSNQSYRESDPKIHHQQSLTNFTLPLTRPWSCLSISQHLFIFLAKDAFLN
jgi:hypothetical protein